MRLTKAIMVAVSLSSSIAFAANTPWLIRLRAIDVHPYPSSSTISVIGGHVNSISNTVAPEFDVSYFFTPNIAVELILATTRHSTYANGTSLGHIPLGSVNVLPPTLTLQYHFLPLQKFNPYVGAGLNYTYFYSASSGPVATKMKYGSSVGPALQLGVDYALNDHWLLNADMKWVYLKSHVSVNTALGRLTTDVKLNPAIFGVGVGYRF